MHYLWWAPLTFLVYGAYAWISKQSHELGGIYFWILIFIPIPIWAIVTRISSNLLIDGLIYDISMMLGFMAGLIVLGASSGFVLHQYIGLVLAVVGVILMKIQG